MVVIIPASFVRVEPPLIYDSNWIQFISPSMVTDKRENVPLIRVKKLIGRYFLVRNAKFQITQIFLVRALAMKRCAPNLNIF